MPTTALAYAVAKDESPRLTALTRYRPTTLSKNSETLLLAAVFKRLPLPSTKAGPVGKNFLNALRLGAVIGGPSRASETLLIANAAPFIYFATSNLSYKPCPRYVRQN